MVKVSNFNHSVNHAVNELQGNYPKTISVFCAILSLVVVSFLLLALSWVGGLALQNVYISAPEIWDYKEMIINKIDNSEWTATMAFMFSLSPLNVLLIHLAKMRSGSFSFKMVLKDFSVLCSAMLMGYLLIVSNAGVLALVVALFLNVWILVKATYFLPT